MLHTLNLAALYAAEGGHEINEELHAAAPWFGIVAFIIFLLLLVAAASFSSRGKRPEIGEYEDPAALPADEQAMLRTVETPRH